MRKLLCLLFLVSFIANAQKDSVNVDLSNPHATLYTHLYFLQSDSYQPKKAAKTILGLSEKEAVKKAIRIKKILDGKGLIIDFDLVHMNVKLMTQSVHSSTQAITKILKITIPLKYVRLLKQLNPMRISKMRTTKVRW